MAGCFALACFSVAIIAGMAAERDASIILWSAILALFVGQFIGLVCGWMMSRAFTEALVAHAHSEADSPASPAVSRMNAPQNEQPTLTAEVAT